MLHSMIPFVFALGWQASAWGFTAPTGWIQVAENRAVLDPENIGRGQIWEFSVSGGAGDPDELHLVLLSKGIEILNSAKDESGSLNLAYKNGLGRANFLALEEGGTWTVVLVDPQYAAFLDPDAVLSAAAPVVANIEWEDGATGDESETEGAPWGGEDAQAQSGWAVEGEAWTQGTEVVGTWAGSALIKGAPTKLVFQFENNGKASVTMKARGIQTRSDGTWATRGGVMRTDLPGGGEVLQYNAMGSIMSMDYDGVRLTLHRQ